MKTNFCNDSKGGWGCQDEFRRLEGDRSYTKDEGRRQEVENVPD